MPTCTAPRVQLGGVSAHGRHHARTKRLEASWYEIRKPRSGGPFAIITMRILPCSGRHRRSLGLIGRVLIPEVRHRVVRRGSSVARRTAGDGTGHPNTHVSAQMNALVAARLWPTVFRLPAYAPEFNPVEEVWAHEEDPCQPRSTHRRRARLVKNRPNGCSTGPA